MKKFRRTGRKTDVVGCVALAISNEIKIIFKLKKKFPWELKKLGTKKHRDQKNPRAFFAEIEIWLYRVRNRKAPASD